MMQSRILIRTWYVICDFSIAYGSFDLRAVISVLHDFSVLHFSWFCSHCSPTLLCVRINMNEWMNSVCPSVCPSHAGIVPKRLNSATKFFLVFLRKGGITERFFLSRERLLRERVTTFRRVNRCHSHNTWHSRSVHTLSSQKHQQQLNTFIWTSFYSIHKRIPINNNNNNNKRQRQCIR